MRTDILLIVFSALILFEVLAVQYEATVTQRSKQPALSIKNPKGAGYSPCEYTFNPGWIPDLYPEGRKDKAYVIVRAAKCPNEFGGQRDHMLIATCYNNGTCDDISTRVQLPFEDEAQDPRIIHLEGWWYLFYYARGSGLKTTYLRRSRTPLIMNSWESVALFPWHRNGCMLIRDKPPHYCLYGEAPPLKAVGLATTVDMKTFTTINDTLFKANSKDDKYAPEVVIEASTPIVQLSTGDYFHIYCAGTPGWVANGNYTCGYIILDAQNPNVLKQKSQDHFFGPITDYEIGSGIYPVQRKRTIFATSLVPTGRKDEFRVWYGAADANVASAIVNVKVVG
ncbi:hypothetical protein AKO1_006603 [Acrasis kona]|uniref:Uncharacterized protein n=1 Tax=Acrasis kona TaxID=1008807 RepID=A0AAW2ZLM6_9EUKA